MKLPRQESHPDNPTLLPRPPHSSRKPPFSPCPRELAPPYPASPPYPRRSPRPAPPHPLHLLYPLPPPSLRAGADLLLQSSERNALGARGRCPLAKCRRRARRLRLGHSVPHRSVASSRCLCTQPGPGVPPLGRTLPAAHRIPKLRWASAGITCLSPSSSGVLSPTWERHPSAFSLATRRPRRPGGRPVCLGQVRSHKGPRCLPLLMHPRVRSLCGARPQCQGGWRTGQTPRPQETRARREGGRAQRGHQAD